MTTKLDPKVAIARPCTWKKDRVGDWLEEYNIYHPQHPRGIDHLIGCVEPKVASSGIVWVWFDFTGGETPGKTFQSMEGAIKDLLENGDKPYVKAVYG